MNVIEIILLVILVIGFFAFLWAIGTTFFVLKNIWTKDGREEIVWGIKETWESIKNFGNNVGQGIGVIVSLLVILSLLGLLFFVYLYFLDWLRN